MPAGMGLRIGEVLAVSWREVDLVAGTVDIGWRLVRITGKDLLRMPCTKSTRGVAAADASVRGRHAPAAEAARRAG
jgi:integrase